MNKLNSENVTKIFTDCLYNEGENTNDRIECDGVMSKVGFKPQEIQKYTNDIYDMLKQLPEEFMREIGGGYSFLMACNDKDGNQWTGLHQVMEQLFLLGIAIGKVECLMPKELWSILPGGMPYYVVN